MLELRQVGKQYGGRRVLRGVSFKLDAGEVLGVIGPSGGGKTTLLRCVNLLEVPDEGVVEHEGLVRIERELDGRLFADVAAGTEGQSVTNAMSAVRRRVGLVFQGFNLWEERNVQGNLILAPVVTGTMTRRAAKDKALMLCKHYGLGDRVDSPVSELSGGERQRVAIMRALMMEPRLVMLDEVTSALDPILSADVLNTIRELRHQGYAMIVVTHHVRFAQSVCDRVMFLSNGRVVQLETPQRLVSHPATREVEEFLEVLEIGSQ